MEMTIHLYRRRRHRLDQLTIENEIIKLRHQGLVPEDDVRLWEGK